MTKQPVPWERVFHYLENLGDENLSAADYAIKVRKLYDVLVEDCGEAEDIRNFLSFRVSAQQHVGKISRQHHELVLKLLPTPPRRKPGRPKGALAAKAYDKRQQLYTDWIYEKTFNPSLTKEQFAKTRLGITDEDLTGEYEIDYRAKVDVLLQDLKPARMKQLDEGERRSIEIIYPLVLVASRKRFYDEWCAAKKANPKMTEREFVKQDLNITDEHLKRYPEAEALIRQHMHYLQQGRQLSDGEESG